jgi:2-polyprenyl-3-methyl-5-hydroxy-6-metoxy-1,4-benzoquinol methylase
MADQDPEYKYSSSASSHTSDYLFPVVRRVIEQIHPTRIFEMGCGNGSAANLMSGYAAVTAIDSSDSGVGFARKAFPQIHVEVASVYDDLARSYGRFPMVVSLEVVEHLYNPRLFAARLFDLLEPGGTAVISTPYHGYWKNLILAVSDRLDDHFTALWDGGHIKFWSVRTLGKLLSDAGFVGVRFVRVGRWAPIAKSMVAIARKPA